MKTVFTTLFAMLFIISFASAQQIARDKVLIEICTGTWCQFCPGAAMGADDMIANGHDVAIIEYHGGDSYQTTASAGRISYLGNLGFPNSHFDGGLTIVGGSNTQSQYNQFLSRYNQRIVIPSSFSIDIEGEFYCLTDFDVDVTVEMVDPYVGSDIRLHCAVTESEIEEFWQGQDHLSFVQRLMLPSHNGTPVDFSGGNTINQNYQFSIDPDWKAEHCEIVIFLQEHSTKEVLQATKLSLLDMTNMTDLDASMKTMSNILEKSCTGKLEPKVEFYNFGNENLSTLTLKSMVNGVEVDSYDWTGDLAFLSKTDITLPEISFDVEAENEILIYATNPNGSPDQCPWSDTLKVIVNEADIVPTTAGLFLRTDDNPTEITWELKDAQGAVLYSGGPYTEASQTIQEEFVLDGNTCYQFLFYDAGGDGLNAPGFFALYHGTSTYILQGIGDFGSMIGTDFQTDDDTGIEDIVAETEVKVYPNPFSNYTNLVVNSNQISHIKVNMYNILGELVFQSDEGMHPAGENRIRISGENLENGIYFVQLMVNDQVITERITLAR